MQKYLIKTKRLGLRLLEEGDIELLSKLESDPKVRSYFHPIDVQTREEIESKLGKFVLSYEEERLPWFVIFELDSNEYVGRIGFWQYKTGELEFGFALHKDFWGQGFGTEAVSATLMWAKENIDNSDIIAVVTMNNVASSRVLEKCGMQVYKIDLDQGEECRFYRLMNR